MKEKLLFVAPNVPLFDHNSGDLRFFTILELLSKDFEITYLARSSVNGMPSGNRYISCLKDLGVHVHVESYSIVDVMRKNRFMAAMLEFYFTAEHYLSRIRLLQPSCPVIIDTVDVHYTRYFSKYHVSKDAKDLRQAQDIKKRELEIYRKADMVLAVTPEDAGELQCSLPDLAVRIVPNIHRVVPLPDTPAPRNELIFIGGFDHGPNTDAMLYFCNDIFPLIRSQIPEARLTILGSNPPSHIRSLNNEFISVTGYVPLTRPYLQKSSVSVAPLRYGAGMKGKIGEAMAHGLPVVTTSVGASGIGLINRMNAMIADTPEDFASAVVELLQDDVLYRTLRKNAADHIASNFTDVQVAKKLESILEEIERVSVKKLSFAEKTSFLFNYACDVAKKKLHLT